jgi:hypothetical protein
MRFLCLAGVAVVLGVASPLAATKPPSFGRATNYVAGSVTYSVAVGDLNGDGRGDLAAANHPVEHRLGAPQQGERDLRTKA